MDVSFLCMCVYVCDRVDVGNCVPRLAFSMLLTHYNECAVIMFQCLIAKTYSHSIEEKLVLVTLPPSYIIIDCGNSRFHEGTYL